MTRSRPSWGEPATTGDARSVAVADVNGDGALDLIAANGFGDNLTVFYQVGPGAFGGASLTLGDASTTSVPVAVEAADLDGDGDVDLVSANDGSDELAIFFQTSPDVFDSVPVVLGGPTTTAEPVSITIADLDGDGDLDLISADLLIGNLTVFLQTALAFFDPVSLVLGDSDPKHLPNSIVATDLDGDGDLDLVSANGGLEPLTVLIQAGRGTFDPVPVVLGDASTIFIPSAVQARDLDGDGDLDLVAAGNRSDNLTVFIQNGPGSFDPAPQVLGDAATTDSPNDVKPADIDGDGDLDLVSANTDSDTLTIFLRTDGGPMLFDSVPITGRWGRGTRWSGRARDRGLERRRASRLGVGELPRRQLDGLLAERVRDLRRALGGARRSQYDRAAHGVDRRRLGRGR